MNLFNEDYNHILTSRLQSGSIERHISKYKKMKGCRSLVSLGEVNNSENILKLSNTLTVVMILITFYWKWKTSFQI